MIRRLALPAAAMLLAACATVDEAGIRDPDEFRRVAVRSEIRSAVAPGNVARCFEERAALLPMSRIGHDDERSRWTYRLRGYGFTFEEIEFVAAPGCPRTPNDRAGVTSCRIATATRVFPGGMGACRPTRYAERPSTTASEIAMRRLLAALATSIVLAVPAHAALKVGDAAPEFKAKASLAGKAFDYSLKDALKKGPVVVYFYPSAFTQGCNIQAREFALNMDKFVAVGASIVGVSMDGIERLNDFSADPEYCGGKVAVSSDADGRIARAYDLKVTEREGAKDSRGVEISHGFIERTTFVVTPDGRIATTITGVPAAENVKQALAAVEQLKGARVGKSGSAGQPAPM